MNVSSRKYVRSFFSFYSAHFWMGVKLAARSAAKSEQGITSSSFAVPSRILIKFETEHYERGSFVPFKYLTPTT